MRRYLDRSAFLRCCFPAFAAWALLGAAPLAAAGPYEVEFKTDVVYGKTGEEELKLNLATPQGLTAATPGLLFIHGGGWAHGDKKTYDALIKNAAAQGYVAATINYRLAPKHLFPAQVEDCKCAVRWMRAHAEELHVAPEKIGAIGASAGGHLSMMLGVMNKDDGLEGDGGWSDQSSNVQAVVSYVGPVNLAGEYPEVTRKIFKEFLGGAKEERPEQYRRASPISYVNPGDAPMLLFAGTKDQLVPYEQAFEMAQAMTEAKLPGRVELIIGENHGFTGKEMIRTIGDMMQFFGEHLGKPPGK